MKFKNIGLFILGLLLIIFIFTNCTETKVNENPGNTLPKEDDPPEETELQSIIAGNVNINYIGHYPISFTIQPASLQDKVSIQYIFTNQAHSEHLEVFNSNHEEFPNTVRAKSNTSGTYSLVARASYEGINRTSSFTVTVSFVEYPPETTKDLNDRGGQTIETLISLYDSSASSCNVNPIDNINTFSQGYLNNYIRGVDISSLIEVENAGGKFYDNDRYHVGDVLELLSYYGINWVRIRLWNDPYHSVSRLPYGGGTNDLEKAIELSQRAKKWRMKVLLDFHYSDFWTHPGQQALPKAWLPHYDALNADALAPVLKQYTKDVLTAMYEADVLPDMVQIGNETNSGFCGYNESGNKPNEQKLMAAGFAAVREISAQYDHPIKTMIHATDGPGVVNWYINLMRNLDFDVIGISYYPAYEHGTRAQLQTLLQNLANNMKKEIVVVEYSVAFTTRTHTRLQNMAGNSNAHSQSFANLTSNAGDRTIRSQAVTIRNFNNDIMNYTLSDGVRYGIGSFWWEPAWLPLTNTAWAFPAANEWYRMSLPGKTDTPNSTSPGSNPRVTWSAHGFFSYEGTALPSLNAFLQMMGKPGR